MQLTTTSQKAFVLKANATGMNIAKNLQFFIYLFIYLFILNLEKQWRAQNTIKKPIVFKIKDQRHILECISEFYKSLFKKWKRKTAAEIKSFLSHINIAKLSEDKANFKRKI